MADWTIGTGSNPTSFGSKANTPQIRYFQESTSASSAVIRYGDIVCKDTLVSTGGFRIMRGGVGGGGGANLLDSDNILGTASEGSTGDGSGGSSGATLNRGIGVFVADGLQDYIGHLVGGANVSASSLIGQTRAVRWDSTNKIYAIDSTNSTAALHTVVITEIPDGTAGDTNGQVIFKFLSSRVSAAVRP